MSLTNGERANRGIPSLSVASDLSSIAERHSRDMAASHSIYHDDNLPNEVSGWNSLGENVGRGPSASSIHQAFMASATHRVHILGTQYNQIGVGAVRGDDNYLYVTEVFAGRGSAPVSPRRVTGHRSPAPRPAAPHVQAPMAAPVFVTPCRSVGMLLDLLALDEPLPTAQKYIPGQEAPP